MGKWGEHVPVEQLRRKDVREFLDWAYERAVMDEVTNPGRTANKAREHLCAILEQSPWGWLLYRRVKTGKAFYRSINRLVHAHLRSIMPDNPRPDSPVFLGGGARPNTRFETPCVLAGIKPGMDIETGRDEPRELTDLRKTCATYHNKYVFESSIEILGHSVGGITYRHDTHRVPLAFKAIMALLQPTAFSALLKGHDGECPCCRRRFADAV